MAHGVQCYSNDWLIRMDAQLSMTYYNGPDASGQSRKYIMHTARSSNVSKPFVYSFPNIAEHVTSFNVRPALFLKPSVKIVKGSGIESDPYIIS